MRSALRVFVLGCLGASTAAYAGPTANQIGEFQHTAWTTDPTVGAVFDVQQDRTGFLWLTTSRGVLRFDGMRFETLREITQDRIRDNDILSVYPSHITNAIWLATRTAGLTRWQDGRVDNFTDRRCTPTAIGGGYAEDLDGSLWMQSAAGLSHLRGSVCETVGVKRGVPAGMPAAVFVDRSGTVWVKTAKGDLLRKMKASDRFEPWQGPALDSSVTGAMHQAPDGSIWLSDSSGLRELLDRNGLVSSRAVLKSIGSITAPLGDFSFAADGHIWLASKAGLLRIPFSAAVTEPNSYQAFAAADGITSNASWRLLSDRDGNIWLGTNSGLDRLRPTLLHPLPIGEVPEHEFAVAALASGVYFGNAQMPLTVRGLDGHQQTYDAVKSVMTLRRDRSGRIWCASQTSPRLSYVENGILHPVAYPEEDAEPVLSIAFDKNNDPWIVNRLGTVFRYSQGKWIDQSASLKKRPGNLGALTADDDGTIWIAFSNKLFRWDGFSYRDFSYADPNLNISVSTMSARNGHVWLAGRGGLVLFADGRFQATSWQDREMPGRISGIAESKNGDLWWNGFSGAGYVPAAEIQALAKDPKHLIVARQLDALDGLPGFSAERIPEPSLSESQDGKTLWFATTKGIAALDVSEAARAFERASSQAVVTSLIADGRLYAPSGDIRLPAHTRRLSIAYTALQLGEPERVQFRYQLSGADDQWQEAGHSREVSYDRLPPGRHVFQVQASVDGTHWSTQQALGFTVTPAFYQTWWFRLAIVLAGFTAIYLLLQQRLYSERQRLQALHDERLAERERIARDLHDTLLQGFHGLVLQFQVATDLVARSEAARPLLDEALQQSDKVILEGRDHVMDLRQAKTEPFETSLRAIGDVWKHSRSGNFRVVVNGAPRALKADISDEIYLIAREAISNAFRHANAREIVVEIDYGRRALTIDIRDDGCGIDQDILTNGTRPGHWGLSGMRERARAIGADLNIRSSRSDGTQVTLLIPFRLACLTAETDPPVWKFHRYLSYRLSSRTRSHVERQP